MVLHGHVGTPGIGEFRLSLQRIVMRRELAAGLVAILAETMLGVASTATPDVIVYVALELLGGHLTMAIACEGGVDRPVMSGRGAAAFGRANAVAAALGGTLVRGVADGRMIVAFHMADPDPRANWMIRK